MLPITREKAIEFLKSMNQTESDFNHYLESEAIMRELAIKLGEDADLWAMLGLLHDIDWSSTKEDSRTHLTRAPEMLKSLGFDEEFIENVISHGYGWDCAGLLEKKRTKKVEFALAASETVSGLVHAYALMRGKKVSDMEVKGLAKKFKDKTFAAGCRRDIILECENFMPLSDFLQAAIDGVKKIKEQVGLS
jgi:uncharacterized protein